MTRFEGFSPQVHEWFRGLEAVRVDLGQGLVAGSGYHVMARDQLERYREAVADDRHGPELGKLVAKAEKLRFVTKTWRAAAPVTGWLGEQVGPTTMPADSRYRRR